MTSRSIRRIFTAVLILLPIQYALVGIIEHYHSEPWPALVLPAFQSVWDQESAITVDHATLEATFSDGRRVPIPSDALLVDLPASQHLGFFRMQCQPASLSGTTRTERCTRTDAASWMRKRIDSMYPDRSVRRLDVIWKRSMYPPPRSAERTSPSVHTVPLDTLSLTW